jgi:type III restriction enzyme
MTNVGHFVLKAYFITPKFFMLILKQYQKDKVNELKFDFLKLLQVEKLSSIVFEAPTGSGKTIMMQEFLKQVAEIPKNRSLAFVWLSI